MSTSPILTVRDLSYTFHNNNPLRVLEHISFEAMPHEFLAVIGPSGCGKTTLLRILANLLTPTAGTVIFGKRQQPRIGMVFQDPTLVPWRTVLQNIMLPLEIAGVSKKESIAQAQKVIDLVDLGGFERSWPRELSGGMAQRVSIARALTNDHDLLLLDEPFASLDALTRDRMSSDLARIWQTRRMTVVLVTHSINEALVLADRVLVLSSRPGIISMDVKVDLPRPREDYVQYTPQFTNMARKLKEALDFELYSYRS